MRYQYMLEREPEPIVTSIPEEQRHLLDEKPDNNFTLTPEQREYLYHTQVTVLSPTTSRTAHIVFSLEDARQQAYAQTKFWENPPKESNGDSPTSLPARLRPLLSNYELSQRLYALRQMAQEGDISVGEGEKEWLEMLEQLGDVEDDDGRIAAYGPVTRPYSIQKVSRKTVITFK